MRPWSIVQVAGRIPIGQLGIVCGDGDAWWAVAEGASARLDMASRVRSTDPVAGVSRPDTRTQDKGLPSHEPSLVLGCAKMGRVDKR